ncbi:MAG: hypothetical protein ACK4VN_12570 [Bacteroidales bacterium]
MKTTLKMLPLLAGILLFFTQCEKEAELKDPAQLEGSLTLKMEENDCYVVQDLWAGAGQNNTANGTLVGSVSALIEGNTLTVQYLVDVAPWALTEAHLWVGKKIKDIPRNAAPGLFPFSANLDFESSKTFQVDLAALGIQPGQPVYIAAHAVVASGFSGLEGVSAALPSDFDFLVRFFTNATIQPENKGKSYFETTVSNGGFLDGIHQGWCLDSDVLITTNTVQNGTIYSSYGDFAGVFEGLFDFPENLNKINWIINYDFVGKDAGDGLGVYTLGDVQKAMWILLEESPNPNPLGGVGPFSNARIARIVSMANELGYNFVPGCGQFFGIIIVLPGQQTTLIRFPVLCGGSDTAWAFGPDTFIQHKIARKWGWIFNLSCPAE